MKIELLASLALSFTVYNTAQATEYVTDGTFATLTNGLGQLGYNTDAPTWTVNAGQGNSYEFVMNSADVGSSGQYGSLSLWDAADGGLNSWNGMAPTGDNFVALDGDFQDSPLSQTITGLTPGKTYDLSFTYAFAQQTGFYGPTVQSITTSFGGTSFSTGNTSLPSQGFSGWTTFNGTVTADGTSDVLSFLAIGDVPVPPFALLTDVSITSAVPEPATWAMMIVGLGCMGAAARRRRYTLATA